MNLSFDGIVAIASIVIALIAIWIALVSNRHAKQSAIRETTEIIFNEWWGEELRELRKYFFLEFVPAHRIKLVGKSLKETRDYVPEDKGRIERLCSFFDRIGCLGAAGLIDMSYILEPMQHTMRLTWIAVETLIVKERELKPDKRFDPVYQYGFEWLFRRSSLPHKHQAHLLQRRFVRPSIFTRQEIRVIKSNIEADETEFRRRLDEMLKQEQIRTARKTKA